MRQARRAADKAGVALSDWEGQFLDSVSQRVEIYGRAFADPDKGARGGALSAMQGRKLKEIADKAAGKVRVTSSRRYGPRPRPSSTTPGED